MEIEYLKTMEQNPNLSQSKDDIWISKGMNNQEIEELEKN